MPFFDEYCGAIKSAEDIVYEASVERVRKNKDFPCYAIQQKLYSFAKEFGCEELVEYDKSDNKYYETALFEGQDINIRTQNALLQKNTS